MDDRKKQILRAIVNSYVESAEPVGSKALAASDGLDVSPATLRNEMAALEDMGYLTSPHTSAGRIPTPAGYRLYVDELMQAHRLTPGEREIIRGMAKIRAAELDRLLREAGQVVSDLTQLTAICGVQHTREVSLSHLELFLSGSQTMVMVAVFPGGLVENRVVHLPFPGDDKAVRALSVGLAGVDDPRTLSDEEILGRAGVGFAYWPYVRVFLDEIFRVSSVISGESRLFSLPEFQDIPQARKTLDFIAAERDNLLQTVPDDASGIHIAIGPENAAKELANTSVVLATCQLEDGLRGVVGVLGPIRMDYSRLVSKLSFFADALTNALHDNEKRE